MVRMSPVWACLMVLGVASCDAESAHPSLSGTWTPVSTNDCGPRGETVRFTGRRILYSVNGNRLKIGDILGVEQTAEGLELRYTARAGETPADTEILPERLLFEIEPPDRIKAVSTALDGKAFTAIEDGEVRRVLDLKRCV
jgi:hypothetical protein